MSVRTGFDVSSLYGAEKLAFAEYPEPAASSQKPARSKSLIYKFAAVSLKSENYEQPTTDCQPSSHFGCNRASTSTVPPSLASMPRRVIS